MGKIIYDNLVMAHGTAVYVAETDTGLFRYAVIRYGEGWTKEQTALAARLSASPELPFVLAEEGLLNAGFEDSVIQGLFRVANPDVYSHFHCAPLTLYSVHMTSGNVYVAALYGYRVSDIPKLLPETGIREIWKRTSDYNPWLSTEPGELHRLQEDLYSMPADAWNHCPFSFIHLLYEDDRVEQSLCEQVAWGS